MGRLSRHDIEATFATLIVTWVMVVGGAATAQTAAPSEALPWMGVRVSPMPEALAAHLPIEQAAGEPSVGLMVINLVIDGPADLAGLRRYDVIVSLDGRAVTERMGRFVKDLGRYRPGDRVRMQIIRQGRRQTVTLTMGRSEPALESRYEYRYPEMPSAVLQEKTNVRSAVLHRSGDGWVLENMDEVDAQVLSELPEAIRKQVDDWTGPSDKLERTAVVKGDQTVEIIQQADGRIVVRRVASDAAGQQSMETEAYVDEHQLRQADPEAFAIYQQGQSDPALVDASEGSGAARASLNRAVEQASGMDEILRAGEPTTATGRAMLTLDEADAYRQNVENYDEFIEAYRAYLIAIQDAGNDPDDRELEPFIEELVERLRPSRPEREFKVDPSGRIELRIRKASGELILTFENVQELRGRYPKLYEQYEQLSGDELAPSAPAGSDDSVDPGAPPEHPGSERPGAGVEVQP